MHRFRIHKVNDIWKYKGLINSNINLHISNISRNCGKRNSSQDSFTKRRFKFSHLFYIGYKQTTVNILI